jgi:long-chain acyl-CoA synthetase
MRRFAYLGHYARLTPDKPAVINATTGASITYAELDERSTRLANYLRGLGLQRGDHIAVLMDNNLHAVEVAWAALRSGLWMTPVNRHLTPDEAAYILDDCDARVVVSCYAMRALAAEVVGRLPTCEKLLMADGTVPGWDSYEDAMAGASTERLAEEWLGATMMYSSGTTGRPKGVVRAIDKRLVSEGPDPGRASTMTRFDFNEDTVCLTMAPIYHAAALGNVINPQFCGGTAIFAEKFDAEEALRLIERYRVTHSQWVPTMFIRMLKLDPAVRTRYDLSSLKVAIHAAAPCPVEVKRQMIDWWGPIVAEYYGGTELCGLTAIDSHEALARPGSVGKAILGTLRICDDAGNELPPGQDGIVYFERDRVPFHYHKDPAKTKSTQNPLHPTWTAIGDIGHVDADGYLYLTDRKDFMIISGGVNVYPQAIEDALALHPKVEDVAVIGVPDADMGEAVKAVVEPAPGTDATPELADELIAFVRSKVARYMVPRSVDFIDKMPRLPTGKLSKRLLRARYL